MESNSDLKTVYRHVIWLAIGFLAFFYVFRMAYPAGWDEAFYMAQLSSGIIDGDLLLQNDILEFENPVAERIRAARLLNRNGYHLNAFSIGPALFYSLPVIPVYLNGSARFGLEFQQAIALWTALFWFFGMVALYQTLSLAGVSVSSRYLSIFAGVCSSPFILYGTRFYLTAHFLSAIVVIFCVYFWVHWLKTSSYVSAWAAGLCSGFLVITRWESGVFFLAYLWPLLTGLKPRTTRIIRLKGLGIAVLSGLMVLAVQLSAWNLQFDSWLLMPQEPGFMRWSSPALWKFLISGYHGLIPWAPGILIGFFGLVFYWKRTKEPLLKCMIPGLIAVILIQYYTSAATWDWWGGSSYGPRRFTLLLGPIILGWALFLDRLPRWIRFLPVVLVVVWGAFTMCAFRWQVDDLTLLLTGKPDIYRPDQDPVTPEKIEKRWEHFRYGYNHMRVPGFALKNSPRPPHRRSGFLILLGLFLLGEFGRRALIRSRRFRVGVLSAVSFYIVFIIVVMNVTFVRSGDWKEHWASVVRGYHVDSTAMDFPRGYDDAVRVMETIIWLKSAQRDTELDLSKLYDNSIPGLSLDGLIDYARTTEP